MYSSLKIKTSRYFSFVELIIVMVLISIFSSMLIYNYKGSLDRGKILKTQDAMQKLEHILEIEISQNPKYMEDIEKNWEGIVRQSPLVKHPENLIYDAWGKKFIVKQNEEEQIIIKSSGLEKYELQKKKNSKK